MKKLLTISLIISNTFVFAKETTLIDIKAPCKYLNITTVITDTSKPDLPIPKFDDEEVQKFVNDFADFMKELAIGKYHNQDDFFIKAQELGDKTKKIDKRVMAMPKSEIKKFNDFIQEAQKYYRPSTYIVTEITIPEIPKFADPEVQKMAEDYIKFFQETIALANSSDESKLQEFSKKAEKLPNSVQAIIEKLSGSPVEMKKFVDFMEKIANNYQDKELQ